MQDIFTTSTAAAAGVVLLVHQLLKLNIIPAAWPNKYPVPTNLGLSILATIFLTPIDWSFDNAGAVVLQVAAIAVTAAIAYNQLLSHWVQLKAAEGPGK